MADFTSRFISRGGTILGIAAFCKSRRLTRWNALSSALRHPVVQLTGWIESSSDVVQLAAAASQASGAGAFPSPPRWIRECAMNPQLLTYIGDRLRHQWPPETDQPAPMGWEGGLIALAVTICRNPDAARAASLLFDNDAPRFWDVASIAGVLAPPGCPSALRREVKRLVAQYQRECGSSAEGNDGTSD